MPKPSRWIGGVRVSRRSDDIGIRKRSPRLHAQTGAIDAAIKMQKKAIKAGADDPRIGEAQEALEESVRAKKGAVK